MPPSEGKEAKNSFIKLNSYSIVTLFLELHALHVVTKLRKFSPVKDKLNGKPTETRPKDRSFEAYKTWVRDLVKRFLTQKDNVNLTETEWKKSWIEYWEEKSNNGMDSGQSQNEE